MQQVSAGDAWRNKILSDKAVIVPARAGFDQEAQNRRPAVLRIQTGFERAHGKGRRVLEESLTSQNPILFEKLQGIAMEKLMHGNVGHFSAECQLVRAMPAYGMEKHIGEGLEAFRPTGGSA